MTSKDVLSIDIQLFAEEQQEEAQEEQPEEGATQEEEGQTSEAVTKEDIEKMIQSAEDRVRTEYSKKLKGLEQEKEKLEKEKMSEEEKRKYELEKLQNELSEKENAVKERELSLKTVDLLRENELPLEFAEFIKGEDEESTQKRVEKFKDMFQKSIQAAVEEKFKEGGTDPHKRNKQTGTFTRDQLDKMSPDEINANWDAIQKQMAEGKL